MIPKYYRSSDVRSLQYVFDKIEEKLIELEDRIAKLEKPKAKESPASIAQ